MKPLCFFALVFCLAAFSVEPAHYSVELDGRVLFFVKVVGNKLIKSYPKPEAKLGELALGKNGVIEFTPIAKLDNPDNYFPILSNVVSFSDLSEEESKKLADLIRNSDGSKITLKENTVTSRTGPEVNIPWTKIKLKPVGAKEIAKIEAMEKALLGKWKFVEGEKVIGERKSKFEDLDIDLFKKTVEFCAEGKCILDANEKKFYWIDGKFSRLSFQKSLEGKDYNKDYEYDLIQLKDDELVIRTIGAPFPNSILKLNDKYPKILIYSNYRFVRFKE